MQHSPPQPSYPAKATGTAPRLGAQQQQQFQQHERHLPGQQQTEDRFRTSSSDSLDDGDAGPRRIGPIPEGKPLAQQQQQGSYGDFFGLNTLQEMPTSDMLESRLMGRIQSVAQLDSIKPDEEDEEEDDDIAMPPRRSVGGLGLQPASRRPPPQLPPQLPPQRAATPPSRAQTPPLSPPPQQPKLMPTTQPSSPPAPQQKPEEQPNVMASPSRPLNATRLPASPGLTAALAGVPLSRARALPPRVQQGTAAAAVIDEEDGQLGDESETQD
jgi:hypothetical protein